MYHACSASRYNAAYLPSRKGFSSPYSCNTKWTQRLCNFPCLFHSSFSFTAPAKELRASFTGHLRRKLVVCFVPLKVKAREAEPSRDDDCIDHNGKDDEGGVALSLTEPGDRKNKDKGETLGIIAACTVGLLTGVGVVLFNFAVHEIRDICWDGIPSRGASWLREEPIVDTWRLVISVPIFGGFVVSMLNYLRTSLSLVTYPPSQTLLSNVKSALRPILKAITASVTLGTGNSLGPEGPSVEIGSSIAKGVSSLLGITDQRRLPLIAAGSAAGISSGFNAAVAGCFFAVESVLWPTSADSSPSLTNTTSMVILSAVIASIVSEVGLGSQPAFKVPEYDFRSPSELPLYLLLGVLCGLVSVTLSRCTSYALAAVDNVSTAAGIPKTLFPVLGSLSVGLIALKYPEILYWGFENVNILLESQPLVKGLPADLLLQLVGAKIVATSLSRASGLVGGYYAPSLFIGAATGMAYGKFVADAISQADPIYHLSYLEVASPQAYGLVGMAATLAGVCQVPLTAVLLLFELTQDYRIVLPLLGAVGLSSIIAAGQTIRKQNVDDETTSSRLKGSDNKLHERSSSTNSISSVNSLAVFASASTDLCKLETSLCVDDSSMELIQLKQRIFVSQAMQTRYVTVLMSTSLIQVVEVMLEEKQSCALIVDNSNILTGLLTLEDVQEFSRLSMARSGHKELLVSGMCQVKGEKCQVLCTATPDMNLLSAQNIMNVHGLDHLPVISEKAENHRGHLVGLLDRECISLACRAVATQEFLSAPAKLKGFGS